MEIIISLHHSSTVKIYLQVAPFQGLGFNGCAVYYGWGLEYMYKIFMMIKTTLLQTSYSLA
jgi:hypothetical protein